MKKNKSAIGDLRKEYDFSTMRGGIRGKYAKRYRAGTNLVKIDQDVLDVFVDETSVNDALRFLIKAARQQVAAAH
jgi:hypothetical protein